MEMRINEVRGIQDSRRPGGCIQQSQPATKKATPWVTARE